MGIEKCKFCKFFKSYNGHLGNCKKKAPSIDSKTDEAIWPEITDEKWCGDFERKE